VKIEMLFKRLAGLLRHIKLLLTILLLWPALGGCEVSDRDRPVPPRHYEPRVSSLGLTGYNYTNREISDFSVDGQGGGNIDVSSPTGGGGGTVCCVSYVNAKDPGSVRVRWQSDACIYQTKSTISDEVHEHFYWFFKEADVNIEKPVTQNPQYLEVHFYPDGSVKAAVTEHASLPRLRLRQERMDRTPYPRCPHDKKPAG